MNPSASLARPWQSTNVNPCSILPMSNILLKQVWQIQGIEPSSKLILARLADMANDYNLCWPSLNRLKADTGLARSSVCRILATLEAQGFITKEKGQCTNTYALHLDVTPQQNESSTANSSFLEEPENGQKESHHDTSPITELVPPSVIDSPTIGLALVPPSDFTGSTIGPKPKRTLSRTLIEPKEKTATIPDPLPFASAEFAAVWEEWEEHRKQKKAKVTDVARRRQFKQLAAMGEARAIAAIEHSIGNNWQGIFEPRQVPAWQKEQEPSKEYDFALDSNSGVIDFQAMLAETKAARIRRERILGGEIEPETEEERALVYAD